MGMFQIARICITDALSKLQETKGASQELDHIAFYRSRLRQFLTSQYEGQLELRSGSFAKCHS